MEKKTVRRVRGEGEEKKKRENRRRRRMKTVRGK